MTVYDIFVYLLIGLSAIGPCLSLYGYENPELNLFENWGFEDVLNSTQEWEMNQCSYTLSDDAHTGDRSVFIFDRTTKFGGPQQTVYNAMGNTMYYVSAFFKMVDESPGQIFSKFRFWVWWQALNGGGSGNFRITRHNNMKPSSRWRQLGGDFITPDVEIDYVKVYIELTDTNMNFLMDSASFVKIYNNPNWKGQALTRINRDRKNRLVVGGLIPAGIPYCHTSIIVNQTKADFGIGVAIKVDPFNEDSDFGANYRNHIAEHFDMVTFANALKWRPMEPTEGAIKFQRVDDAIEKLQEYDVSIRGHAVGWNGEQYNPNFIKSLTGDALKDQLFRRTDYLFNHYKGQLAHFDMVNEWLHGTFYETGTNDSLIQDQIYERAHQIDPDTALYTNDFQGLRDGEYTSAIVDQAEELHHKGVPIHGIAVQSHLRTVPINPEILKQRIDILTSSQFPVTISEMSVHSDDVSVRAQQLDDALVLYCSTAGVNNVVFWLPSNVSSIAFEEDSVLFEGEDFVANEAGTALLNRIAEWQTHQVLTPTKSYYYKSHYSYYGAYRATVLYKGQEVKTHDFYYPPSGVMWETIPMSFDDFSEVYDGDTSTCV